jgi:hypothetical protein
MVEAVPIIIDDEAAFGTLKQRKGREEVEQDGISSVSLLNVVWMLVILISPITS